MTIKEALFAGNAAEFSRMLDQIENVNALDEQGWTLLNWAAGQGKTEFVRMLIEKGADVFRRGSDQRTAYLIALAAGHAETVKELAEAENRQGGDRDGVSSRQQEHRPYCRAYPAACFLAFPSWKDVASPSAESAADTDVFFLHQDFTLTRSVLHGTSVLVSAATPEWQTFCADTLGFQSPSDLDLLTAG